MSLAGNMLKTAIENLSAYDAARQAGCLSSSDNSSYERSKAQLTEVKKAVELAEAYQPKLTQGANPARFQQFVGSNDGNGNRIRFLAWMSIHERVRNGGDGRIVALFGSAIQTPKPRRVSVQDTWLARGTPTTNFAHGFRRPTAVT
jgi:hypothetical protein